MRHLFLTAVFLMSVHLVHAQSEDVLRPNGRPEGDPRKSSSSELTFTIGPEVGANFNFFSQPVAGTFENSTYNVLESGFGVSPFVGLYAEVGVSRTIGIGARLYYDAKSYSNSIDAKQECQLPVEGFGDPFVLADLTAEYCTSVNYITVNPLIRWQPITRLFFHFGPVVQFGMGQITTTTTLSVSEDSECLFNPGTVDESRTQTVEAKIDHVNSIRAGIDLGVGYRFPVAKDIDIVPRLGYQFIVTKLAEGGQFIDDTRQNLEGPKQASFKNASLSSLQASIAVWFTL